MFTIQMALDFRPGSIAPVRINGTDQRLHWVTQDTLAILPASEDDPAPPDCRRVLIEMSDEHDPDALRTFYCEDRGATDI